MGFFPRVRAIWARVPQRLAAPGTSAEPTLDHAAEIEYAPSPNGLPDPGEVVWAWVPYEEDPTQGKDRPVLVLKVDDDDVQALPMTSKDHDRDAAQEASVGRFWMDIGTGSWDSQRRPSEVRLNRLLHLPHDEVRREGGSVSPEMFIAVLDAARPYLQGEI
jgi:hypothetical protein